MIFVCGIRHTVYLHGLASGCLLVEGIGEYLCYLCFGALLYAVGSHIYIVGVGAAVAVYPFPGSELEPFLIQPGLEAYRDDGCFAALSDSFLCLPLILVEDYRDLILTVSSLLRLLGIYLVIQRSAVG